MTSATIREIQHNLASVLRVVASGEEVQILRRNTPIAKIVSLASPKRCRVDWTPLNQWRNRFFHGKRVPGKAVSALILEGRGGR